MEGVLNSPGESSTLLYYVDREDPENDELTTCGVVIEYVRETPEYIEMHITLPE